MVNVGKVLYLGDKLLEVILLGECGWDIWVIPTVLMEGLFVGLAVGGLVGNG